jgi:DNA mismatch repair protein MutS2
MSGQPAADGTDALPTPCPPKTEADLELARLREAIAARAVSPRGAALARSLGFFAHRHEIELALAEAREAVLLEERGDPLPRRALPELDEAVERSRFGSVLSSEELRALIKALVAAKELRKFLKTRAEELPSLARACDTDPALDRLAEELGRAFEPDGGLADGASPRLAELRAERRASRDRIVRRLDELIGRYKDLLQDAYWTERDGRYVLPVRADAHERFPGIVHGTSAGGSTLFVEPRIIVPMGNRHKVLDALVAKEEDVVLAELSSRVAESVESIAAALDALAHADLRGAIARLAHELGLGFPRIADDEASGTVSARLERAKHPLLQLDGVDVVPSDIEVRSGHALVVSGPNAGGKTVALKTLGLAVLMLRAGLPIPARTGSELSLFDEVLTDVGDDQSLAKNLSTFSAHVKNLSEILARAHRGSLVLLDELASGTDPHEGEALATAVLESLIERGAAVACTTHYEALKTLALRDRRFENASVGFDIETMSPSFALTLGVPGPSSALAVAKRFGIPDGVVARAEAALSRESVTLAEMIEKMAQDRRGLEAARGELERDRRSLERDRDALEAEREKLARREEGALGRETEALLSGVKRARDELRAAEARLRTQTLTAKELALAEKEIDRAASHVSIGSPLASRQPLQERGPVAAGDLFVGMKVFVPRLKTDADILEILPSGQLRVAAGPLKLLTSVDEVRRAGGGEGKKAKKAEARRIDYDAAADPDVPIQTSDNTVDLRGLRSHEVVAAAEQFLDRCVGSGKRVAFLIHGHGTGTLRQLLRDALRASPYVMRSRPGEPREGGDGVTVVWLR